MLPMNGGLGESCWNPPGILAPGKAALAGNADMGGPDIGGIAAGRYCKYLDNGEQNINTTCVSLSEKLDQVCGHN